MQVTREGKYWVYTECILNSWTNLTTEFPIPKQGKKFILIYVRKHFFFEVQTNVLTSII
jgi:hypothetical protein